MKTMKKLVVVGVSLLVVVLLILGSQTNVIGYQSIQSSNQQTIKEAVNQRESLFQTIVDLANNKEIQRIILKSQLSREGLFNLGVRFPVFSNPVLTKNQLKEMYFIGLFLSKVISKSRIQSIIGKYQFNNQETQKELSAVIEKDAILNTEITKLKNSECNCENEKETSAWNYPVICVITFAITLTGIFLIIVFNVGDVIAFWGLLFGMIFKCHWVQIPPLPS
jgi:hypothetical protein